MRSLGDTGFLMCESTWFSGRFYLGGKLVGNMRMRWVGSQIGFYGLSPMYRQGRQ